MKPTIDLVILKSLSLIRADESDERKKEMSPRGSAIAPLSVVQSMVLSGIVSELLVIYWVH